MGGMSSKSFPKSSSLLMFCSGDWFPVIPCGSKPEKEEEGRGKKRRGGWGCVQLVWDAGLGPAAQLTQLASSGKGISNTFIR